MKLSELQELMKNMYYDRDKKRGVEGTFMWFTEEVGELAEALMEGNRKNMEGEFADVLAWLVSLASLKGIKLEDAIDKYLEGCPGCGRIPCECKYK